MLEYLQSIEFTEEPDLEYMLGFLFDPQYSYKNRLIMYDLKPLLPKDLEEIKEFTPIHNFIVGENAKTEN